jgi:hypothetical protein
MIVSNIFFLATNTTISLILLKTRESKHLSSLEFCSRHYFKI